MTTGGFWGDHGGASEAKGGPRDNYFSDTNVFRSRCRTNKGRARKHPASQNSREEHGGTRVDHGRIVGRPLEFLGGAQEDHGRIIGGTGGFWGEQAITTGGSRGDHGGAREAKGGRRENY